MIFYDFIQGFIIGLSLILAIGPQNLFVIKQGLQKNHVFIVCLICSFADTALIILGITISSYIVKISPIYINLFVIVGSTWLIIYGVLKIKKSFVKKNSLDFRNQEIVENVIATTLFLTFINPHVYLDTIILIGFISQNFDNKIYFGIGAILASFIFFYSLGYFSKFLGRIIKDNKSWFWIDIIFGSLMIIYGLYFLINKN